jgi:hypothetical protein
MTAIAKPARPDNEDDARLRPVPWRRMAGVTWRQHRIALIGVAVLLGALAAWLWSIGTSLHNAYAAAVACHPASSAVCQNLVNNFNVSATNHTMGSKGAGGILLQVLPVLIGAFAGAPVLARELETGTFRYAWTQGFGRWRWALAKLLLLAVVLAAATAAFGALVSWYYQPEFATSGLGLFENSPLVTLFSLREVTFPAWTLAAFTIGALAGMLIRRILPAIVATLAVYAGLAFAAGSFLREHYLAPLATTSINVNLPGAGTAWTISQWSTKDGKLAFAGGNPPLNLVNQFCSSLSPGKQGPGNPFAQCLAQHGYLQWTSYQPATRFWPFQWIEGGWLLALSVLLIAATIWLVQRRAA